MFSSAQKRNIFRLVALISIEDLCNRSIFNPLQSDQHLLDDFQIQLLFLPITGCQSADGTTKYTS